MHPEVPPPTAAVAAMKIATDLVQICSVRSKSANVREDVEQALDNGSKADGTMDDARDDDNDKTITAARDYQVNSLITIILQEIHHRSFIR